MLKSPARSMHNSTAGICSLYESMKFYTGNKLPNFTSTGLALRGKVAFGKVTWL